MRTDFSRLPVGYTAPFDFVHPKNTMLSSLGIIDLWVYVLGAFVIIVIPGPNSLYVLRTAIVNGRKSAFAATFAVLVGDTILILCSYVGIAAALAANPDVFEWIRYAGGVYLGWLGLKILWHTYFVRPVKSGKSAFEQESTKKSELFKFFRVALALSLTNPKAILFFVAFFVQFIDQTYTPTWIPYLTLSVILQTFSVLWLIFLTTAGADMLKFVARHPVMGKLGNTSIGVLFLLFAFNVAFGA